MRRVRLCWMLCLAVLAVLLLGHGTALAYTINIHAECAANPGWVPYGAVVEVLDVDPLPSGGYVVDTVPLSAASSNIVDENGDFTATFVWPTSGSGFDAGDPDLIFRLTQGIGGAVEIIYEEDTDDTRWNVPQMTGGVTTTINLTITSPLAVCLDPTAGTGPSASPYPASLFGFVRIGAYDVSQVDCRFSDGTAAQGYCRPRRTRTSPPPQYGFTVNLTPEEMADPRHTTDMPFGGVVALFGWFGDSCTADYYKVQYKTATQPWTDVTTSLWNWWYDRRDPDPDKWHTVRESMGPFTAAQLLDPTAAAGADAKVYYQIPYCMPLPSGWIPSLHGTRQWSYPNRVALFDTRVVEGGGRCEVRVVGYKKDDTGGVAQVVECFPGAPDSLLDPNYGTIVLQIDNTPPTIVEIISVSDSDGTSGPCSTLTLDTGTETIDVKFIVWDERGHLWRYNLAAMYGHDCHTDAPSNASLRYEEALTATPPKGSSPMWHGSPAIQTVEYLGSDYPNTTLCTTCDCSVQSPADTLPSCAYQFRLTAAKRTTNGSSYIYRYVEDTYHVTIERD